MSYIKYHAIIGKLLCLFLFLCSSSVAQNLQLQRLGKECLLINNLVNKPNQVKLEIATTMLNEGNADGALYMLMDINVDSIELHQIKKLRSKAFIFKKNFNATLKELYTSESNYKTKKIDSELEFYKIICYTHLQLYDSSKLILKRALLKINADTFGIESFYIKNKPSKIYNLHKIMYKAYLFPGVGFFCVDEPLKAFINIALTSSFATYTLFSINKKYYATAILAGISNFLRFYTGGIRGALRIAEKKNIKNYLKACLALDDYAKNKLAQ